MSNSVLVDGNRPPNLHSTKSFSRYEPQQIPSPSRSRSSTLQNEIILETHSSEKTNASNMSNGASTREEDVFEKSASDGSHERSKSTNVDVVVDRFPEGFDDLPIELISLTDRWVSISPIRIHAYDTL